MYRKKLSGAQNRAQASKKVKESEKNKQTLKDLGWFTTPPSKPNEIESGEESETCNQESETSNLEKAENVDESIILSKSNETHGSESDDAASVNESKDNDVDGVEIDQALWAQVLGENERDKIIKKGPSLTLPDSFPRDSKDNRTFPKDIFFQALPNGEKVQGNYLVWSPSSSSLICFPCSLYGFHVGNGNCGSSNKSRLLRWNGECVGHMGANTGAVPGGVKALCGTANANGPLVVADSLMEDFYVG